MDSSLLVELLDGHGFEVKETSTDQLVVVCPLCSDHKPRLYISKEHGAWTCFNCGERGSLFDLLTEVLDFEPGLARVYLKKLRSDHEGSFVVKKTPKPTPVKPPLYYAPLAQHWETHVAQPYRAYVERRGLTRELVRDHLVGYCVIGPYAQRVVFPVRYEGTVVSWIARSINPALQPKVLTAPESNLSVVLYDIEHVSPPEVVLVEGVFDCLRLHGRAVATLGARLSDGQIRELKRRGYKRVILLRDNDEAGREAEKDEAWRLTPWFDVHVARLPEEVKDPGEATDEQLRAALDRTIKVQYDAGRETILGGAQ